MIEEHELREMVPLAADRVPIFLDAINNTCLRFDISTPRREAVFIAHTAVESMSFHRLDERLNYTDPDRVRAILGKHFDPLDVDDAWGYLQQPERFANRVYAGRMGNGDEASGDGWKYRGRGLLQITGKDNYRMCGTALDLDLLENPDKLLEPLYAARSAGWFFKMKGINAMSDKGDFDGTCLRINGGRTDIEKRVAFYEQALKVLA